MKRSFTQLSKNLQPGNQAKFRKVNFGECLPKEKTTMS